MIVVTRIERKIFFFFAYMNAEQRDFQDLICMCPSID